MAPQASWPPDVPAESLEARRSQPGVLSQASSARIPRPEVLSQDALVRNLQPAVSSQSVWGLRWSHCASFRPGFEPYSNVVQRSLMKAHCDRLDEVLPLLPDNLQDDLMSDAFVNDCLDYFDHLDKDTQHPEKYAIWAVTAV